MYKDILLQKSTIDQQLNQILQTISQLNQQKIVLIIWIVTTIIKVCYAIKQSKALKCYLRIMLQIGNLMNHGIIDKSMAYGFDIGIFVFVFFILK